MAPFVIGPTAWVFGSSEGGTPTPPPAPGIPIPRRVPTILWINDTPIQTLGLQLLAPRGGLQHASRATLAVTGYPGLTGGRYESLQAVPPRVVELEAWHIGSDFGARALWLDTLHRALDGLLELRWADTPDRVMRGVATVTFAEGASPKSYIDPTLRVRVTITCADTASYDRFGLILPLSTTPVAVPLGPLPSGGELGINGPYDGDLSIDVLAPTGVTLERLGLEAVELAAGEALTIRLDPPHVLVKTAIDGTQVPVPALRNAGGSTRWWQLVPGFGTQSPRLVLVPADPEDVVTGWYRYLRSYP